MLRREVLAVAVLTAVLVGCGSKAATKAPQPTSPSPTASTAPSNGLTGIGSTIAAMKAAHGAAQGPGEVCSAANSCFGPGVHNDDSGNTYQFTDVSTGAGLITGYDQNFLPNTSLATAQQEILRWFPPDATAGPLTVDHNGGSCGLYDITSATLGRLFSAPAIGDPQGVIGVELQHVDANLNSMYDPGNIQTALLSVAPVNPSDNC